MKISGRVARSAAGRTVLPRLGVIVIAAFGWIGAAATQDSHAALARASPLQPGAILDLPGAAFLRIDGARGGSDAADLGDQAGYSVSAGGDINGDGVDDVIVAAPRADPRGRIDAGSVYVIFGGSGGDPSTAAASIDLAQLGGEVGVRGFRIDGAADHDYIGGDSPYLDWGGPKASTGDVNGDGRDDVILGAPFASPYGWTTAGAAYIVFGKESTDAVDLGSFSAADPVDQGFRIAGAAAGDWAGISVAGVGDMSGDGMDEVIVGTVNAASAYVVLGGSSSGPLDLGALDGDGPGSERGFRLEGATVADYAGSAVASAGDLNGDGADDVIIGAPNADPPDRADAGSAYVVFGDSASRPVALGDLDGEGPGSERGFRIDGAAGDDLAGRSVAGAGDLNGDGADDVIVGAPWADPPGPGGEPGQPMQTAGAAYIVYGRPGGGPSLTDPIDLARLGEVGGSQGFRIEGAAAGDQAGREVAGGGDLNGDGLDDVVVGAPYANLTDTSSDPPQLLEMAGAAYVVFGSRTPELVSLRTLGARVARLAGAATMDWAGHSVAAGGDVNGDGGRDLVVGAPRADPGGRVEAGSAYVILGSAPPLIEPPLPLPSPDLGPPPQPAVVTPEAAEDCTATLRAPLASMSRWRALKGSLRARLKVAPGGHVIRPDREARFVLEVRRAATGARARVRRVIFRLDGRHAATDRRAPFTVAFDPGALARGRHALVADVRVRGKRARGKDGRRVALAFQVSGCEAAAFSASMSSWAPRSLADVELRAISGGPELSGVTFHFSRALRLRTAGLRQKRVGTIQLIGASGAAARAPRHGRRSRSAAARRPGSHSPNAPTCG